MDITFLGDSGFKIKGKTAVVLMDPFGQKGDERVSKLEADIVALSEKGKASSVGKVAGSVTLSGPGEYEIKEVKVVGVPSFQDDKGGKEKGRNTVFNVLADGLNICHLGNFGQKELTNEQMELIGNVDVLLLPVKETNTFDAGVASKIISELEPKIVVPMYEGDGVKSEAVEKLLKEMGTENVQPESRLSIKGDKLPEETTVVLLEKAK